MAVASVVDKWNELWLYCAFNCTLNGFYQRNQVGKYVSKTFKCDSYLEN